MYKPLEICINTIQLIGTSEIEAIIEHYKTLVDKYLKGKQDLTEYTNYNKANDVEFQRTIANNLNLPIDVLFRKKEFKTVTFIF